MSEKFEFNKNTFEEPRCPYCGKRMCGSMAGSGMCEPDIYKKIELYSSEQIKALKEDWDVDIEKLKGK